MHHSKFDNLEYVFELIKAGVNIIPCNADKSPAVKSWAYLQKKLIINDDSDSKAFLHSILGNCHSYAAVMGAISNLECIDIDNKLGNADFIGRYFIENLPNDFKPFVYYEHTKNLGYHFIFRSFNPSSNSKLASGSLSDFDSTLDPILYSEVQTIIETRGEGGYVLVAPSPNYVQLSKVSLLEVAQGGINDKVADWFFSVSKLFDRPSSSVPTVSFPAQPNDPNTPWAKYNEAISVFDCLALLQEFGWQVVFRRGDVFGLCRPGKNAKEGISATFNFYPKKLFVFSSNAQPFEANRSYLPSQILAYLKFNKDFSATASYLSSLSSERPKSIEEFSPSIFPKATFIFKKDVAINFIPFHYIENLEFLNYFKLARPLFVNVMGTSRFCEFIMLVNNVATAFTLDEIVDNYLNYLKNYEGDYKMQFLEVFHRFASKFRNKDLLKGLHPVTIPIVRDQASSCIFIFKNGIFEVRPDFLVDFTFKTTYDNIVWSHNILPYDLSLDYSYLKPYLPSDSGKFCKFCYNICTFNNVVNTDRLFTLFSILGYLLHSHKKKETSKAIVLYDAGLKSSSYEAKGQTGKGILIQAISIFRNVFTIAGKKFDANDKFQYAGVDVDTNIVAIQDPKSTQKLDNFFNDLADGLRVERKFHDPIIIPHNLSPKFVITSNTMFVNNDSSSLARKFEFELSDYYSNKFTPIDDPYVGELFGDAFTHSDWNDFFSLMFFCASLYLTRGLIPCEDVNLQKNKDIQILGSELYDFIIFFASTLKVGDKIVRPDFIKTCSQYCDSKFVPKSHYIYDLLERQIRFNSLNFIVQRGTSSTGDRPYIYLITQLTEKIL